MVLEILFVVTMFLWLLTILPFPPLAAWTPAGAFLCFVAVLLLGLFIFMPAMR